MSRMPIVLQTSEPWYLPFGPLPLLDNGHRLTITTHCLHVRTREAVMEGFQLDRESIWISISGSALPKLREGGRECYMAQFTPSSYEIKSIYAQAIDCVYQVSTDLLPRPLLIRTVSPVCRQNNAWLNLGSPAAQFVPPQFKVLTFNSPFYPNSIS